MSSLMQHDGEYAGNRVVLKACRVTHENKYGLADAWEQYRETCPVCGKCHAVIYTFARRPVGMWGCWAEFRINGEVQVPDLSIPMDLVRLPRDAEPMTFDRAVKYWHS